MLALSWLGGGAAHVVCVDIGDEFDGRIDVVVMWVVSLLLRREVRRVGGKSFRYIDFLLQERWCVAGHVAWQLT